MDYANCLEYPENYDVSDAAKDLISNLICDRTKRYKILEDFQNHPFFENIDWNHIRNQKPPYEPQVSGPDDTSNFDTEEFKQEKANNNQNNNLINNFSSIGLQKDSLLNVHLPFIGYTCTFTKDQAKEGIYLENLDLNKIFCYDENSSDDINVMENTTKNYDINKQAQLKISNLERELFLSRKEWSEMSNKLKEMHEDKILLTSKLRGKEEEFESQLNKLSDLRLQLRDAESSKRGNLKTIIDLETKLQKEKQLRKENQYEIKELGEKISIVEEKLLSYQSINEISEKKNYEREQIDDLNYQLNEKQEIIKDIQKKIFEAEQRLIEQDQMIKIHKQQENRIKELEDEISELKKLQPNWENQIAEIIDWVGSEKEARTYLQEIAINMSKDLDNLKQQKNVNPGAFTNQYSNVKQNNQNLEKYSTLFNKYNNNGTQNDKNTESNYSTITWQERRSARVEKQELLQLQLELKNEIEDKQRIQNDLTRIQREMNSLTAELNEAKNELMKIKNQQKQENQKSSNQFQLSNTNSLVQPQLHLRNNSNSISGTSSNRQSLNLNNGCSLIYQTQKDLQQKINAIQLSPLQTTDFSDMELSGSSSPTSELFSSTKSSKRNQLFSISHSKHSFIIRTFAAPLKCFHCTSLMIGLIRQGFICEICGFVCHVSCANPNAQLSFQDENFSPSKQKSITNNPIPVCPYDESRQRPVGIDPIRGIGQ
ncbi:hypothetical protein RND71_043571 [Anisodus tanguticus]|uniref:non-specific serine/threonine protein kinase n=1 Tax=Anisodus tanguticus TaxID=243964 RepID=A0AAE1QR83_9SOLA|nr:hypothetical protein RND71_043571 [Anisodus tanguticus]